MQPNTADEEDNLTTTKVFSLLVEFIEVIIEQVCYYRNVYPSDSYQAFQSYNLQVYRNRHPGVQIYLKNLAMNLMGIMRKGQLNRVFVNLIEQRTGNLLETYGFSFINSVLFDSLRIGNSIQFDENAESFTTAMIFAQFRSLLHSVINDLSNSKSSKDTQVTFRVIISTSQSSFNDLSKTQNWLMKSLAKRCCSSSNNLSMEFQNYTVYPEVELGYINIKGFRSIESQVNSN